MNRVHRGCVTRVAFVAILFSLVTACANNDAVPSERTTTTPESCAGAVSPVPFNDRHPDKRLHTWVNLADGVLAPATCVHQSEAVNLFVTGISDQTHNNGIVFAVDFDNGYLYTTADVLSLSHEDLFKPEGTLRVPDAVLSTQSLAELREAIDQYRVLEWPFREPGEPIIDGEYTVRDGFELAVVFYDDTGSYAERPEKSDSDMIGFLQFAQAFIAEQLTAS